MAQFCTNCGKELQEGEVCTCTTATPATAAPQQAPANSFANTAKNYVTGVWNLFLALVKKPSQISNGFVGSCDFKPALILIGLYSVLTGIFTICMTGEWNGLFDKASNIAGGFGSEASSYVDMMKFPQVKVFFISAIATFAVACGAAALLFLIAKIFKFNTTYKQMLCVSGINSLISAPFVVVGIVASFIFNFDINISGLMNGSMSGVTDMYSSLISAIFVPVIVANLGTIIGGFVTADVLSETCKLSKDRSAYATAIYVVVLAIVVYFVFDIVAPMCYPEAFETMGSIGDVFSEMF